MPATSQPLDDLREIAVLLNQLSEEVHQMTHKLELAVEGTYASEFADPRVQVLTKIETRMPPCFNRGMKGRPRPGLL